MSTQSSIPIVIGTYAKLIKPSTGPDVLPLYSWTCVVYLAGRPWADLSFIIDRVDFTLHKSFPNHIRKVTKAPFTVSAEGWGEFPILVEIHVRNGGVVKFTHYLKLTSPESIVVNESFDNILHNSLIDLSAIPDLAIVPDVPVFSEFVSIGSVVDYTSVEETFLATNGPILQTLAHNVASLTKRAMLKEMEYYTILNSKTPSSPTK